MSGSKEISAELISTILSQPSRATGQHTKIPGTSRSSKIDYEIRTFEMWWKLPTTRADCTIELHDEEEHPRNSMCAKMGEVYICRRCFLNSLDRV